MIAPTCVLAPNPSIFTGAGTNTYLVGDEALVCIDPGPDDDSHLAAILDTAAQRHGRIVAVLVTHSHPDHRPLARRLARATASAFRAWDPGGDAAVPLADGEVVQVGGLRLRVVHTPGHAGDHVCFLDEDGGALYTGDHVLSGTTTVISPPDGDMTAYVASLRRIRDLRPTVIYPGHGAPVGDAVGLVDEYLRHRREREEQIAAAARARGAPLRPADLVPEVYAGYPPAVWPLAERTVEAHLDKLVREGRATRLDHPPRPRYLVR